MTARAEHTLNLGGKRVISALGSLAVAASILAGLPYAAQSQTRRPFETASIKASKVSTVVRRPSVTASSPTLVVRNASLQFLIQMAYQIRDFQLSGGPGWIGSDQYDIDAKAEGHARRQDWLQTMRPMLQALLNDRFKLKLHRETKKLPVFVLTVAKGSLKMRRSQEASCASFQWVRNSPAPSESPFLHCGALELINAQLNHTLDAFGMSMKDLSLDSPGLTTFLSNEVRHIVIDKTGLTGLFDFRLEWNRQATADATSSDEFTNPSIFTALQEQLGLRLESANGPVEVLVIDHAEKPGGLVPSTRF